MRGEAGLRRALKAVVGGLGLSLRTVGATEGFKQAHLSLRFRYGDVIRLGQGEGKEGDRRTEGKLSRQSGDRGDEMLSQQGQWSCQQLSQVGLAGARVFVRAET